jgi:signal transduction histidine kinase
MSAVGLPRIALPRAVAARVVVTALATTQRVIAAVGSLLAAGIVIDALVTVDALASAPLLVAPFLGVGMLALLLLWRPTVLVAGVYLLGGAILSVAVPVLVLDAAPELADTGPYLFNRIATALCLVGAIGGRALSGVLWSALAFLVGQGSVMIGLGIGLGLGLADAPVRTGAGPLIVASISVAAYATLAIAQRQTERRLAALSASAAEQSEIDRRRSLELRAAAVVHDTILADLALIARSSGPLDARTVEVLDEHLQTLATSTVADAEPGGTPAVSALGAALLELAREYQWSGVRVDVSGIELLPETMSSSARHALLGATRAALDNVVEHAGTDRAELVAGARGDAVSVLVVDDGLGFSAEEVGDDRLGLRTSVTQRIERVGGTVRVWSGPEGTTVMLTVPRGEGSR